MRAVAGLRFSAVRGPSWVGCLAAVLLFAGVAMVAQDAAAQFEAVQRAQVAYQAQDYAGAVRILEPMVGGATPTVQGPTRLEARKFLGASYVFLNRRSDAEEQFTQLLREDPNHELDRFEFSREVLNLFASVRTRVRAERARREQEEREREAERRQREAERILRERDRVQRLEELARQMIVEEESSRWIATIPFGVGQFQNDDEALGWFFFATEAVFLAANITTLVLYGIAVEQVAQLTAEHRPTNDPDVIAADQFEDVSRYLTIGSFGVLAATMIAGIIEAHASFESVRTEVRERELPPDLQPEPDEAQVEPVLLDPMETPRQREQKLSISITPFGLRLRF